jgi:hypothetical protein
MPWRIVATIVWGG